MTFRPVEDDNDMFESRWVLKYSDGSFVGVNTGRPYKAIHPRDIHWFSSFEDAELYRTTYITASLPREEFTAHKIIELMIGRAR